MSQTSRREFLKFSSITAAASLVQPGLAHAQPNKEPTPELQALLDDALAQTKVVGASAAVYHRGEIQEAAGGVTNVTTGVPVDTKTVMHIGSITKVLNATLVMQLVDDNLVDLEAPVVKYLPDWKVADADATKHITVAMLLNHTSGIDGEMWPEQGPDKERIEDAIPRIAQMGQTHEPGKFASYCNAASLTAGYLVQRLRGKSWYEVMREDLFDRLGMTHAIALPEDALLHRASVGHFIDPQSGKSTRTTHAFLPLSFAPAGASPMMSAGDLVRFGAAHLNDGLGLNGERLITKAGTRSMQSKTAAFPGYASIGDIGRGWIMIGDRLWHSGGGPGIYSTLTLWPEKDLAIAVLTNSSHGGALASQLTNSIAESTAGIEPEEPTKHPFVDDAIDPARYVGTYDGIAIKNEVVATDEGIGISITAKMLAYDDSSLDPSPVYPLKPVAKDAFGIAAPGATDTASVISFINPGPDGRPQHITSGARMYRRT